MNPHFLILIIPHYSVIFYCRVNLDRPVNKATLACPVKKVTVVHLDQMDLKDPQEIRVHLVLKARWV